jgi:PAS domain S-box-containing protein
MNTGASPRNAYRKPSYYSGADIASTVLRFSREVFCVLDAALRCHYLTENWEALSGFAAIEDMGEEFKSHIAPDHMRRVSRYLEEGDDKASLRFQIKSSDGHWRWCEMQLAGVEGRDPERLRYKCLLRDVTDVVMSQGKLEKFRLEADLAIKSRSEFLANMSHELRTPLNAILGFAQMIESGTYGDVGHPKYHDYVGSIQESGTTLLSKINDLLEIANIDTGRMELRETEADLADILRHAIEFHSHRAFAGQINLRLNLPPEPLVVLVDRIRMLQVLTNLMSNAIKHNQPGGTVDICCEVRRDGGVNIIIEDNGGGILPTHLQNILTAFRQDNSFFARSRDCVGLGLALSKEIVKLHQGRIEIDSAPGKGTLLTIRLPRERTVRKAAAPKKVEPNVVLSVN